MKLSTSIVIFGSAVTADKVKTLFGLPDEDRKVPPRHPLQRLWRLYQFSEEIIQEHMYNAPGFKQGKLDRIRNRIGKWQYMAARQSFLRNSKKCGFYDADQQPHGGPTATNDNSDNNAGPVDPEQTLSQASENLASAEVYNPRPNRKRRSDESEEEFWGDDELRYNRADPCHGIKQIQTGFKKWAHRYIGGCGGQAKYEHQEKRAEKFYKFFVTGLKCNKPGKLWQPKN